MNSITVKEQAFELIPVKTHMIKFGEDLAEILRKYTSPQIKPGDFVAISEKVASVCQNNVRHISTVKAGWLARLIVKGVKKYPNDIGYSRPEKMQVAVDMAGQFRMFIAMIIGGIFKIFGVRGLFWRIAGHRVSEIDGFNPDAMWPYTEYAILPPKDPEKTCNDLELAVGYPVTIIDANNIDVQIIAKSSGLKLDTKTVKQALITNPMGQDDELTPLVIVRRAEQKII